MIKSIFKTVYLVLFFVIGISPLQPVQAQGDQEVVIARMIDDISGKLYTSNKIAFSIIDFTDNSGKITGLGRYLADKVSMAVSKKSTNYKVMEKNMVHKALLNNGIPEDRMNDIFSIKDACIKIGIQVILTGQLIPMGDNYELTLKAIDINDGSLLTSTTGKISKTAELSALDEALKVNINVNTSAGIQAVNNPPANVVLIGNRWELTCKSVYANGGQYWMLNYSVRDTKYDPKLDEERIFRMRITKTTSEKGTVYLSMNGITNAATFSQDLPVNGTYEINRYQIPSNTKRFIFIEGELSITIDGRQMTKTFSSKVDIPVE